MSIVLFRVDERLIHGQVVIGWGSHLRPDRYVVVDDILAASEWEQELYRLGLPEGVGAEFMDVAAARRALPDLESDPLRTILLTRNVATMARLAEDGVLEGRTVNLGGIHHGEGRVAVRPWLHLDEDDRERIRALREEGAKVTARDLPGSSAVSTEALLDDG